MRNHLRITFRQPEPGKFAVAKDDLVEVVNAEGEVIADISDSVTDLTLFNKVGDARAVQLTFLGCQIQSEQQETRPYDQETDR